MLNLKKNSPYLFLLTIIINGMIFNSILFDNNNKQDSNQNNNINAFTKMPN